MLENWIQMVKWYDKYDDAYESLIRFYVGTEPMVNMKKDRKSATHSGCVLVSRYEI